MNLVLWAKNSSAAIPFSTLLALLFLWFCVSVPLTFLGALIGFRKRVSIQVYTYIAYILILDIFFSCIDIRFTIYIQLCD